MAVPDSEEVGFKRIGMSANDYDASLPIKKRRFPVVQSPPSASKDIYSFHPEGNLVKTEPPSPPKDVSSFPTDENLLKSERPSLSVTVVSCSIAATSSGLSNKNHDCVSDENKAKFDADSCYLDKVKSDVGIPGVKFQEPSLGGRACFNDYVKCEDKSLVTEKHIVHASPEIRGGLESSSTRLNSDQLVGNNEDEINVKVEEAAEVSISLKEHMDPKLVAEESDLSFLEQNSLEPALGLSLNKQGSSLEQNSLEPALGLSLNKQGSSTHFVIGNMGSDYDGSLLHSSRENWDLNTSMESWEGCTNDVLAGQISATQTNTAVETNVDSSEMVDSDKSCGKQTCLDSEHIGNSIDACVPSKDHLYLSLNSSYPKPMHEEDPYLSEYESDGNWDIAESVDDDDGNTIEEDYEDGEFRETMLETEVEKREIEPFDHTHSDGKKINSVGLPDPECFTLGPLEREAEPENSNVIREDDVYTITISKSCERENQDLCVEELLAVENTISEDVNRLAKATGRSQLSQYDEKDTADKTIDGFQELIPTVSGEVDEVQNKDLTLPCVKESVNSDDVKDIKCGTKNSRIINLSRASADTTPCKAKSGFVRSVLSRTDREFVPSFARAHEGANVQPQGRDDTHGEITKKFSVDRYRDQSSWMNFSHRRRGGSINRLDTRSEEWDFGPNFSPEMYSDQQIDYHVPGPFGGANHRSKRFPDDEDPFFFHGPSRRKSPGRRHGPSVRGGKMVNRMTRGFSPGRCMDEGSSFDRQHGEKFSRNFADDTVDPMYERPQPPYEVDRPFFRERRNFSFQRKSFPRIDSKSPVRSRDHSPSQWFSSKRSDRFGGRPDMTHRRSPSYRTDRMRSPDQRPTRGYMAGRRQGFRFLSPSDDVRDVSLAPNHGPIRSTIPNRNQTERLPHRNRSFDPIDPRERMECDELFDASTCSGQLNGYSGGEHDGDERRFNERHEPVHSFKHPYDDSDGERFRNNREDCSRPFRFCADNDSRISWKRR